MTNATAISAALHRNDFVISPGARRFRNEGIFVSNGCRGSGTAYVAFDYVTDRDREFLCDAAWTVLFGLGYRVRRNLTSHTICVEGKR